MRKCVLFAVLFSLFTMLAFCEQKENKVVFISGGTKGIGLETAKVFSERGYSVWAVGRSVNDVLRDSYPNIHFLFMDITDPISIDTAVHEVLSTEGHIDTLVNNAGYGLLGADEAVTIEQARAQFDVNFFGLLELTQKVLPSMRKEEKGHIINISSTSGIRAVPGLGLYAASKFALEALSESMAVTLSPFNIKVSVIEPGAVANGWAANCDVARNEKQIEVYSKLATNLQEKLIELAAKSGQGSREIALLVFSVANCDDPHLRYQTSKGVEKTVSHKLKDLTGDDLVSMQKSFLNTLLD